MRRPVNLMHEPVPSPADERTLPATCQPGSGIQTALKVSQQQTQSFASLLHHAALPSSTPLITIIRKLTLHAATNSFHSRHFSALLIFKKQHERSDRPTEQRRHGPHRLCRLCPVYPQNLKGHKTEMCPSGTDFAYRKRRPGGERRVQGGNCCHLAP